MPSSRSSAAQVMLVIECPRDCRNCAACGTRPSTSMILPVMQARQGLARPSCTGSSARAHAAPLRGGIARARRRSPAAPPRSRQHHDLAAFHVELRRRAGHVPTYVRAPAQTRPSRPQPPATARAPRHGAPRRSSRNAADGADQLGLERYVTGDQDARGDGSQGPDERVLHRKPDCIRGSPDSSRNKAAKNRNVARFRSDLPP